MPDSRFVSPLDSERLTISRHGRKNNIYKITMHSLPENKLDRIFSHELMAAFKWIETQLGKNSEGAVITTSAAGIPQGGEGLAKFWCTGTDVTAASDGFFPLYHTILNFPFPTIAEMTGHAFGGGCMFALCHDYRVMNSERGYINLPMIDLGAHWNGGGLIVQLKLNTKVAWKVLVEAHRYTGKEAAEDKIVNMAVKPNDLSNAAMAVAEEWAPKAKAGAYALMRLELYGPASEAYRKLSTIPLCGPAEKSKI